MNVPVFKNITEMASLVLISTGEISTFFENKDQHCATNEGHRYKPTHWIVHSFNREESNEAQGDERKYFPNGLQYFGEHWKEKVPRFFEQRQSRDNPLGKYE